MNTKALKMFQSIIKVDGYAID